MTRVICGIEDLHTKTPPYNPSYNIIEQWHRTIMRILRTMGREMQNEWDLGVKVACLASNTKVHASTGQTTFLLYLDVKLHFWYTGHIQYLRQTEKWNYQPGQRQCKKGFRLLMLACERETARIGKEKCSILQTYVI